MPYVSNGATTCSRRFRAPQLEERGGLRSNETGYGWAAQHLVDLARVDLLDLHCLTGELLKCERAVCRHQRKMAQSSPVRLYRECPLEGILNHAILPFLVEIQFSARFRDTQFPTRPASSLDRPHTRSPVRTLSCSQAVVSFQFCGLSCGSTSTPGKYVATSTHDVSSAYFKNFRGSSSRCPIETVANAGRYDERPGGRRTRRLSCYQRRILSAGQETSRASRGRPYGHARDFDLVEIAKPAPLIPGQPVLSLSKGHALEIHCFDQGFRLVSMSSYARQTRRLGSQGIARG